MPELFVNQLTPSTLNWRAGHLKLTLTASPFAADNVFRSNITLEAHGKPADSSRESILRIRVPAWVRPEHSSVSLHREGEQVLQFDQGVTPGDYISLKRCFKTGAARLLRVSRPSGLDPGSQSDSC